MLEGIGNKRGKELHREHGEEKKKITQRRKGR
jgi:hypothetical protein